MTFVSGAKDIISKLQKLETVPERCSSKKVFCKYATNWKFTHTLPHGCSPVKSLYICRAPFATGGLLLKNKVTNHKKHSHVGFLQTFY